MPFSRSRSTLYHNPPNRRSNPIMNPTAAGPGRTPAPSSPANRASPRIRSAVIG